MLEPFFIPVQLAIKTLTCVGWVERSETQPIAGINYTFDKTACDRPIQQRGHEAASPFAVCSIDSIKNFSVILLHQPISHIFR